VLDFRVGPGEKRGGRVMPTQFPRVTIPNTEVRTVSSSNVGQEYKIFVALPHRHTDADKSHPVLYVLDANWIFGLTTEAIRLLQLRQELPELIVVGIAYPVEDVGQIRKLRARDFTPTVETTSEAVETHGTGGAGNYLRFIRQELIPFIQSNYRVKPEDRAIAGASLGGLFALYALFHHPDTFNRYIVVSPSIWWDEGVTFAYERNFAAHSADLSARVFMSMGALEKETRIADMQRLAETLEGRGHARLELTTCIFEHETHVSGSPAAMSRGLRVVFA
jgi:hypothetical protein